MSQSRHHQSGIVMLEALLAIILFTFVSIALMNIISQSMNHQKKILDNRCANWLAENLLTQEFLSPASIMLRESQGKAEQCDREWTWKIEREEHNDNRFYMINLEINNSEGQLQLDRQTIRAK